MKESLSPSHSEASSMLCSCAYANPALWPEQSSVQSAFLHLLRLNEGEGLRLIRSICNHSTNVWKWAERRGRWGHAGLTPLPIRVKFPWGEQTFWGDGQVYLW